MFVNAQIAQRLLFLCVLLGSADKAQAAPALVVPPSVGCPAEGMGGPIPPPVTPAAAPPIAAASAHELAYYTAGTMAVLAPRDWHCIEMYGSGGAFLLVTPLLYTSYTLPDFNGLHGPAIELDFFGGAFSGRTDVADLLSRLFPFRRRFIREVAELNESFGLEHRFPSGPYPTDTMLRRSRSVVDFTTPPYREGLGTFDSRLGPGASPIIGTAILEPNEDIDNVVVLGVRLPPDLRALAPVILDVARKTEANLGR